VPVMLGPPPMPGRSTRTSYGAQREKRRGNQQKGVLKDRQKTRLNTTYFDSHTMCEHKPKTRRKKEERKHCCCAHLARKDLRAAGEDADTDVRVGASERCENVAAIAGTHNGDDHLMFLWVVMMERKMRPQ
jgi:hypothetical protein